MLLEDSVALKALVRNCLEADCGQRSSPLIINGQDGDPEALTLQRHPMHSNSPLGDNPGEQGWTQFWCEWDGLVGFFDPAKRWQCGSTELKVLFRSMVCFAMQLLIKCTSKCHQYDIYNKNVKLLDTGLPV